MYWQIVGNGILLPPVHHKIDHLWVTVPIILAPLSSSPK